MIFKIDTKAKFTVITPESEFIADNLTADFFNLIETFYKKQISLVINLKNVTIINEQFIRQIAALKKDFYAKKKSFVLCELTMPATSLINQLNEDEALNITPSETEAWDIVQMEEMERELMQDDEDN